MLDPCDALTNLMTIQRPMNFQLTWLFIFMCVHWTSTLHYIRFIIDMAHNSDVSFDNSWHDLTWNCWHGLACWSGNVKLLLLLSDTCVLGCDFASPPHSLVCGVFNDILSWEVVACMCSLCLFLISSFAHLAATESLRMLPSYFSFIISPWLKSVPVLAIHSWWDDINPQTPYSKMVHYHSWTELGTTHRLEYRAQWLHIL